MMTKLITHRLFILLAFSLIAAGCQESAQEKADREVSDAKTLLIEEKRSAYVLAQEVLNDRLPNPQAVFYPYFDPNFLTLISPHHFLVSTYLDLPDRSGRRARSQWSAEVHKEGDKFLVDHVTIAPSQPVPENQFQETN